MSLGQTVKRAGERLWCARDSVPVLNAPIPWPLPYGGWFLAHGDPMGVRVAGYHLSGHPYEECDWKFVRRYLKRGDTFIDVGANQGFFTILASRICGPSGRVIAFEPAPPENAKLYRNLRLNRCSNVTVEGCALGARDGSAEFHLYPRMASWSSLREAGPDVTAPSVVVTVPIMTLDSHCRRNRTRGVDMVKIDVEGGELDVLRGAVQTLERWRPLVLCEVQDSRTRPWGYSANHIEQELAAQTYDIFTTTAEGLAVRRDNPGAQNVIAIPAERTAKILNSGVLSGAT